MSLRFWFGLFLAFSVGMGCAVALRTLHFEADLSANRRTSEPKTKILVAIQPIPGGIEITADFVAFHEVPLSEVPLGALTNFSQVYRRQPVVAIPEGCPICEDLLLPNAEAPTHVAFVTTGSQLVSLDIVHVRQGNKVFAPHRTLSSILAADQPVDIRVVPRDESRGRLAEMKNEVLRNVFPQDSKNSGELVVENATIYAIDTTKDVLTLMLSKNEADKLTAAAKKGHIRIVTRGKKGASEKAEMQSIVETAMQSRAVPPSMPVTIPVEQPLPTESIPAPIVAAEKNMRVAPLPVDIVGTIPAPAPELTSLSTVKSPQSLERIDRQVDPTMTVTMPEIKRDNEEKMLIRNDVPTGILIASPHVDSSGGVLTGPSAEPLQKSAQATPPPTQESERAASSQPYFETIMGTPRVSQTIQFLPPGSVFAKRNENSLEVAKRSETGFLQPTAPSPAIPQKATVPTVISPPVLSERAINPSYSPFERRSSIESRIYMVLPTDEGGEEPSGELPVPPPLLRVFDVGVPTV